MYVSVADGKAYRAYYSTSATTTAKFLGFAIAATSTGATASICSYGFLDGFTGLTINQVYGLPASAGGALTAYTYTAAYQQPIGVAVSSTTMRVVCQTYTSHLWGETQLYCGDGVGNNAMMMQGTLASVGNSQGLYAILTMSSNTNHLIRGITTISDSCSYYADFISDLAVNTAKTVNTRYGFIMNADTGAGSVTDTYFVAFPDASSPFLTGVTTHDTEADEIRIYTNAGLRYIKVYS